MFQPAVEGLRIEHAARSWHFREPLPGQRLQQNNSRVSCLHMGKESRSLLNQGSPLHTSAVEYELWLVIATWQVSGVEGSRLGSAKSRWWGMSAGVPCGDLDVEQLSRLLMALRMKKSFRWPGSKSCWWSAVYW